MNDANDVLVQFNCAYDICIGKKERMIEIKASQYFYIIHFLNTEWMKTM